MAPANSSRSFMVSRAAKVGLALLCASAYTVDVQLNKKAFSERAISSYLHSQEVRNIPQKKRLLIDFMYATELERSSVPYFPLSRYLFMPEKPGVPKKTTYHL